MNFDKLKWLQFVLALIYVGLRIREFLIVRELIRMQEESDIIICFFPYGSYSFEFMIVLLIALGVSLIMLKKNNWKMPESILDKIIIMTPILLFVLDWLAH